MARQHTMAEVEAHLHQYCHNMLAAFCGRYDPDESGCWIWRGKPSGQMGYGHIHFGPRGNSMSFGAHRFSWLLHRSGIPNGLYVLHRCDVPLCVNPRHLFLGTAGDNMRDAVAKGRQRNQNTGRTHCRKGHELSGDNVKWEGRLRRCRACYEQKLKERKHAR